MTFPLKPERGTDLRATHDRMIPLISAQFPRFLGIIAFALMLGSCGPRQGSQPHFEPILSTVVAPACSGEGKRLLSTIEQRTSSSLAVGKTVRHYDRLGRVTRVESDVDGDGQFEQIERYTYDEAGRLIGLEDADWVEHYQLDREGRVAVQEKQRKGSKLGFRIVITFDDRGRVVRELGGTEDVRYGYDATRREVRERRFRPDEEEAYVDYVTTNDSAGRPLLQQGYDPDGQLRKTWSYDERGLEQQREWYRDGALLLRTRVRYDAAGRRVSEEHTDDKGKVVGIDTWTYDSFGDEASHRTDSFESNQWTEERYSYTAPMKCRR